MFAQTLINLLALPILGAAAIATQLGAWAIQTLAAYAVLYALNLQGKAGLAAAAAILLAVNLTALVPVTPPRSASSKPPRSPSSPPTA